MSCTFGSLGKLTPKRSARLAYWIHSWAKEGPDTHRINAATTTEIRRMMYPPQFLTSSPYCQKTGWAHRIFGRAPTRALGIPCPQGSSTSSGSTPLGAALVAIHLVTVRSSRQARHTI